MLRYKEKKDLQGRLREVETEVRTWRVVCAETPQALRNEFYDRLKISFIYHDAALEGDILTHSEIKAAIDPTIISDASLIPSYETIKYFNEACIYAEELISSNKPLTLDVIRDICAVLDPEEAAKGCPYRKDNPLHRLYYHDICQPDKIPAQIRKFSDWIESDDYSQLHPIEQAARSHFRLMQIFPWSKRSGRTARLLSHVILRRAGYPMAVIHSIDRQSYYEALRNDNDDIVWVYLEAIETTAKAELQVYSEAARLPERRRA